MASKRRLREKSCNGKIKHTLTGALQHKKLLKVQGGENIHAYKCRFCKYYHIGHY